MSLQATPLQTAQTVSTEDIDGRIAELEAQRNYAQSRCALLAGKLAEAVAINKNANAEIDRLTKLLNPPAGDAAAPVAPNPDKPLAPAGEKALTH